MSADLLKRAAEKLRERAEAIGSTSPWKVVYFGDRGYPQRVVDDGATLRAQTYDGRSDLDPVRYPAATPEYIALMHPPVALALAELLDDEAKNVDDNGDLYCVSGETLGVARAILREVDGD